MDDAQNHNVAALNCRRHTLCRGAGLLARPASGPLLERCILAVSVGKAMIDQQVTTQVLRWIREGREAARPSSITGPSIDDPRPLVRHVEGEANQEIAPDLHVEHSVIMTRSQQIYKRLHISGNAEKEDCRAS